MALRFRGYKLRGRMGLEKGSGTEALDVSLRKISSLKADVAKLQESVGAHIRNLRSVYASGAAVAQAFGSFFDKDADAPVHPCVGSLASMYSAGSAGPPLNGVLEHITDSIQCTVAEGLEKWLSEVAELEKQLEDLKKSELRKRHDYYTKKVETLTSQWEAASANDQAVAADSALDEKLDRNTKKLSDAARAYYTSVDTLAKQTDEVMEIVELYIQKFLAGLCVNSELLFSSLHHLSIGCSNACAARAGAGEEEGEQGDGSDAAEDLLSEALDTLRTKTPKSCEGPMQRKGWVSSTEQLCTLRGQHCLLYPDSKAFSEGKRPLISMRLSQVDVDGFVDDHRPGGFRLMGTANTEDMSDVDLEALDGDEGGGRGKKSKHDQKLKLFITLPRADRKRHAEWSQALQSASSWSHGVVSTRDLQASLKQNADFALAARGAKLEMEKEESGRKAKAYREFEAKSGEQGIGRRKSMGALFTGEKWNRRETFNALNSTGGPLAQRRSVAAGAPNPFARAASPLDAPAAPPPSGTGAAAAAEGRPAPAMVSAPAPKPNPFMKPTTPEPESPAVVARPPTAQAGPLQAEDKAPATVSPPLPERRKPSISPPLPKRLSPRVSEEEVEPAMDPFQPPPVPPRPAPGAAGGGQSQGANPFARAAADPGPPPPVPPRLAAEARPSRDGAATGAPPSSNAQATPAVDEEPGAAPASSAAEAQKQLSAPDAGQGTTRQSQDGSIPVNPEAAAAAEAGGNGDLPSPGVVEHGVQKGPSECGEDEGSAASQELDGTKGKEEGAGVFTEGAGLSTEAAVSLAEGAGAIAEQPEAAVSLAEGAGASAESQEAAVPLAEGAGASAELPEAAAPLEPTDMGSSPSEIPGQVKTSSAPAPAGGGTQSTAGGAVDGATGSSGSGDNAAGVAGDAGNGKRRKKFGGDGWWG